MKKILQIFLLFFMLTFSTCSILNNFNESAKDIIDKYNLIKVMNSFKTGMTDDQKNALADKIIILNKQYDLTSDPLYALSAPITESSFNINVRMGTSGELGDRQIMPSTAKEYCDKLGIEYYYGIQKDPLISVEIWFLMMYENKLYFDGSLDKASLAYNMGRGRLNGLLNAGYSISQIKNFIYYNKGWGAYDDKINKNYQLCLNIIGGVK